MIVVLMVLMIVVLMVVVLVLMVVVLVVMVVVAGSNHAYLVGSGWLPGDQNTGGKKQETQQRIWLIRRCHSFRGRIAQASPGQQTSFYGKFLADRDFCIHLLYGLLPTEIYQAKLETCQLKSE